MYYAVTVNTGNNIELVRREQARLYWFQSGSYCWWDQTVTSVLAEYDLNNFRSEEDLWIKYCKDFPPRKGEPSDEDFAGWISTHGMFYPCGFCQHAVTADRIAGYIYGRDNGESYLEAIGWIRVETNGFCNFHQDTVRITQSQFDVLFDLWNSNSHNTYKETMEEQMSRVETI